MMEWHNNSIHDHYILISIVSSIVFFGVAYLVYKIVKRKDK